MWCFIVDEICFQCKTDDTEETILVLSKEYKRKKARN